jgi:hypothetical protein
MTDWADTIGSCGRRRYQLYGQGSWLTFHDRGHGGTHEFRVNTGSAAHIGTHKATFYIDFYDHPNINPIVRVKKEFNVIIDAECVRSTFDFKSITTTPYMIRAGQRNIDFRENEMKDSVSTAATRGGVYGGGDGYGNYWNGYLSYCGRRTYTFLGVFTFADHTVAGPGIMSYYSNYYYKQYRLNASSTAHYGKFVAKTEVRLDTYTQF